MRFIPTETPAIRSARFVSNTAFCMVVLLAAGTWSLPAAAEEGEIDGRFRLGYRFVDTSGNENKYREDLNLDEGARLFELRLDFEAPENLRTLVDRASLDVQTFGGDPFETLHLRVQRFGSFDFRFDRTESIYFYEDIILPPELASVSLSSGGDFHHFDFDRVRDRASLKVDLTPAAQILVGFDRFTKKGESTTTLDVSRDEFELDQPVDESYDQLRVGLRYSWPKATLVLEERYTEYDNHIEIFLPGASLGENPTGAELDFFFFDRPYSYESNEHVARISARPNDRLLISAAAILGDLELEGQAGQRGRGIAFNGVPLEIDRVGAVDIERDSQLFDVDLTYLINDRMAIVGGARSHQFDQEGTGSLGTSMGEGLWDVETTAAELGLEMTAKPGLTLAFGLLTESRDVEHGESGDLEEVSTDHDGYFARLGWKVDEHFRVDASVEDSSYDDPFTLTAPTDRQRLRLRAKYTAENGVYADGTWLSYSFENGDSGWDADRDQLSLRLGYRKAGLDVAAGYNLIEADNSIDQTVITRPGFGGGVEFLYPVLYRSDADFLDARLRLDLDRVKLGAEVRFYDNSGTFGIERDDLRGFVEIPCYGKYLVHLAYRTVDYDEKAFDFDDYDAEIFEVSVGYDF